jgi:hypothetical protein
MADSSPKFLENTARLCAQPMLYKIGTKAARCAHGACRVRCQSMNKGCQQLLLRFKTLIEIEQALPPSLSVRLHACMPVRAATLLSKNWQYLSHLFARRSAILPGVGISILAKQSKVGQYKRPVDVQEGAVLHDGVRTW